MNWKKTTIPDGAALLAFAVFLAVGGARVELRNWNNLGISPRAFPYTLAVCIGFMGLMLLIGGLRKYRAEKGSAETEGRKAGKVSFTVGGKQIRFSATLFMLALSVLYLLLWKRVGFLILTPIFMWSVLAAFGVKPKKALLITIGVVAVIYGVFTYGFKVTLPDGLLRGIL